MDLYSRNKLKRSDAESGSLVDWATSNTYIVTGGPLESTKCFQLYSTASMSQSIPATTQPPDVKAGGFFLPEYPTEEPIKKVFIRVMHHYGEGDKDIHLIPCVESGGVLNDVV